MDTPPVHSKVLHLGKFVYLNAAASGSRPLSNSPGCPRPCLLGKLFQPQFHLKTGYQQSQGNVFPHSRYFTPFAGPNPGPFPLPYTRFQPPPSLTPHTRLAHNSNLNSAPVPSTHELTRSTAGLFPPTHSIVPHVPVCPGPHTPTAFVALANNSPCTWSRL